jgi:A/G-specific adenine glycosylase
VSADNFGHKLVTWYLNNHRKLPWRETKDPYSIWLSEIILQQTRVAQGRPYYEKFVSQHPNIQSFAAATEKEILHLWQGLGYYSRARNMHATAKTIVADYGGTFPETYKELLKLKGVGDYTASAIASFAFDEQTPVVDGNVFRVLSRYYGIEQDIAIPSTRKVFKEAASLSIPEGKAAVFNQAIMEFGAVQCTPIAPKCADCVLSDSCFAFRYAAQSRLPVKTKKTKIRERFLNYVVLRNDDKIALKERTERDIWKGLYDFFSVETAHAQSEWMQALPHSFSSNLPVLKAGPIKHLLSHQHLHLSFWELTLPTNTVLPAGFQWYTLQQTLELPKPLPVNVYLNDFL